MLPEHVRSQVPYNDFAILYMLCSNVYGPMGLELRVFVSGIYLEGKTSVDTFCLTDGLKVLKSLVGFTEQPSFLLSFEQLPNLV